MPCIPLNIPFLWCMNQTIDQLPELCLKELWRRNFLGLVMQNFHSANSLLMGSTFQNLIDAILWFKKDKALHEDSDMMKWCPMLTAFGFSFSEITISHLLFYVNSCKLFATSMVLAMCHEWNFGLSTTCFSISQEDQYLFTAMDSMIKWLVCHKVWGT